MKKGFSIIISSNPVYDKLVAEIYYDSRLVALLNQDDTSNGIKIEFPKHEGLDQAMICRCVPYDGFFVALEEAKWRLTE
jgi:hypothetical protein